MADERNTSNVPPEPGAKPGSGRRARAARPARAVEGNRLWDRPQLLNLISDVLIVVGAAGLGYAAVTALSRLPAFPLREVVVMTPLAQVTTAQLEYVARSSLRGNFFTVDLDDVRASFEKLPWVRRADVRRRWPGGVEVRLETRAALDTVKALAPDAVVVATGSLPVVPQVPGIDLPHVVQGWDVLMGKAQTGKRVAVVSQEDYYETPCVAEYLAERGKDVVIFHKSVHLATEVARYSIGMVLKRMEQCGVKVWPNRLLKSVSADALEFVSSWGEAGYRESGFDSVVLVCGSLQQPALYEQLKADGSVPQLYLAGSAWVPRRLAEATRHGADIGLLI